MSCVRRIWIVGLAVVATVGTVGAIFDDPELFNLRIAITVIIIVGTIVA